MIGDDRERMILFTVKCTLTKLYKANFHEFNRNPCGLCEAAAKSLKAIANLNGARKIV